MGPLSLTPLATVDRITAIMTSENTPKPGSLGRRRFLQAAAMVSSASAALSSLSNFLHFAALNVRHICVAIAAYLCCYLRVNVMALFVTLSSRRM